MDYSDKVEVSVDTLHSVLVTKTKLNMSFIEFYDMLLGRPFMRDRNIGHLLRFSLNYEIKLLLNNVAE